MKNKTHRLRRKAITGKRVLDVIQGTAHSPSEAVSLGELERKDTFSERFIEF